MGVFKMHSFYVAVYTPCFTCFYKRCPNLCFHVNNNTKANICFVLLSKVQQPPKCILASAQQHGVKWHNKVQANQTKVVQGSFWKDWRQLVYLEHFPQYRSLHSPFPVLCLFHHSAVTVLATFPAILKASHCSILYSLKNYSCYYLQSAERGNFASLLSDVTK